MGIVFALRGTAISSGSYPARFAPGGHLGTPINAAAITTSSAGLSGTIIDMTNIGGALKYLSYPGAYNVPNGRVFSILIRLAPSYTGTPAGSRAIWNVSTGAGPNALYMELRHDITTGNLTLAGRNETNNAILGVSPGVYVPVSGTYNDVLFTWDGTSTAGQVNLYVDNVKLGAGSTSAAAISSSMTNTWLKSILIGFNVNVAACAFKLDEFVIWDSIINPASVGLVSGSGALNGASRTSLVDVPIFGGPFTGSRAG